MTPTLALTDAITCLGMEWAERVREAGAVVVDEAAAGEEVGDV